MDASHPREAPGVLPYLTSILPLLDSMLTLTLTRPLTLSPHRDPPWPPDAGPCPPPAMGEAYTTYRGQLHVSEETSTVVHDRPSATRTVGYFAALSWTSFPHGFKVERSPEPNPNPWF